MRSYFQWIILLVFILSAPSLFAQMGIGTDMPDQSAQLDIVAKHKGLLIPRVELSSPTDQMTITAGNTESLLVYNLTTSPELDPGFYYWHDNRWRRLITESDIPGNINTDLPDNIVVWDPNNDQLLYIDSNGNTHPINIDISETLTSLTLNADDKILEYRDENGDLTQIDLSPIIQDNQSVISLEDGVNTSVDQTTTGNNTVYKVNVDTARGALNGIPPKIGVVKEADDNPSVLINQHGELSVNDEALNSVKEIDQDYTVLWADRIILVKATNSDITVTLPTPNQHKGKKYTIKKGDNNADTYVNIVGNIAGTNGQNLYTAVPYTGWDLVSDGTQWVIINKF